MVVGLGWWKSNLSMYRHNNLLNTIIIYDNYCKEDEPSYDDFESRLKDKIGDTL